NIYADKTLLAAFAAGTHTVSADHARAAVSDTQIVVAQRAPRRRLAAVGAVGLLVGVALGYGIAQLTQASGSMAVAAPPALAPAAQGAPPPSPAAAQPAAPQSAAASL